MRISYSNLWFWFMNIFVSLTNQLCQQLGYLLNTLVSQDSHSVGFDVLPGILRKASGHTMHRNHVVAKHIQVVFVSSQLNKHMSNQ